jgi:hypothetical protein
MLGQLVDKMAGKGYTPRTIHMDIGDVLPEYCAYTSTYDSLDTPHLLTLTRQRKILITGSPVVLNLADRSELASNVLREPIDSNRIKLNETAIQELIPQGPNIQFIDAVITPNIDRPEVLAEGVHVITHNDYASININDCPYYYFDRARLLEGFGQLAYIHFQQQSPSDKKMTPFFKEVTGHFNTTYQPKIGETINYQLTHFSETDSEKHSNGKMLIVIWTTLRNNFI